MLMSFKDHWNVYVSRHVHRAIITLMWLQVSNFCGSFIWLTVLARLDTDF
jgi:hypothetical protein